MAKAKNKEPEFIPDEVPAEVEKMWDKEEVAQIKIEKAKTEKEILIELHEMLLARGIHSISKLEQMIANFR